MGLYEALFWVLAIASVGAAAMVLFARNIVHMAFWLLACLGGFAGLYLHLGADFLGFTQVVIYIGGILILFLFGVMLTHRLDVPVRRALSWRILVPGTIAAVAVGALLVTLIAVYPWVEKPPAEVPVVGKVPPGSGAVAMPTADDIGGRFMSTYILPFEVVSVLLLVAMVGATYIARAREEEPEAESGEEEGSGGES